MSTISAEADLAADFILSNRLFFKFFPDKKSVRKPVPTDFGAFCGES